jgi:uncharacterized membrane protein HdeD (DUF308 family)
MSSTSSTQILQDGLPLGKKKSPCDVVVTVLFIVLAIAAVVEPTAADLRVTLLVGWLLILAGIKRLMMALKGRCLTSSVCHVLIAMAYLTGGLYCLHHPLLAISTSIFPFRKCLAWSQQ